LVIGELVERNLEFLDLGFENGLLVKEFKKLDGCVQVTQTLG